MKNVTLVITVFLFSSCLFYNTNKAPKLSRDEFSRKNLRGKVLSLTESTYNATELFGELKKKELVIKFFNKYNEDNMEIEKKIYNADSSLNIKYLNQYDNNGRMLEGDGYLLNGDLDTKITCSYDSNNVRRDRVCYANGNLKSEFVYKYDKKGNATETVKYSSDGSLIFRDIDHFDANGNRTDGDEYSTNSKLNTRFIYEYDDKGSLIKVRKYNFNNNLIEALSYKYVYDNVGNWIHQTIMSNNIVIGVRERAIEYVQ